MLLRRCYVCIRICLCYDAPRFFWTCPKTSWSFQVSSWSIKAHHELLRSTTNFVPTPLRFLKVPKSWSTVWKFVYVGKGLNCVHQSSWQRLWRNIALDWCHAKCIQFVVGNININTKKLPKRKMDLNSKTWKVLEFEFLCYSTNKGLSQHCGVSIINKLVLSRRLTQTVHNSYMSKKKFPLIFC